VPYTDFTVDSDRWGSSGSSNWYALSPSTKLSLSWDNYLLGNNDNSATSNFIGIFTPVFTQNVVSGREITLSFLGAYHDTVETFNRIALRNMNTGGYQWFSAPGSTIMDYTPIDQTIQTESTTGSKFSHGLYTLTVTPNFSGKARFLIGGHISGDPVSSWIRISNVKVEKAGNASAYTPSSNDANERWSQITQTTDNISSEVGKKVGNDEIISKINQSAEKVSINADKISITGADIELGNGAKRSVYSEIKNARDGANIANSINNASTSVRIMGDHINLTGNVTFEAIDTERKGLKTGKTNVHPNILSNWGMTSISGGKIQTDQMTAKRINIVRDDGVEVTNNGRLKNDFIVASFSPNFMSQPKAGGNASWDIFYQRGQWWTFN